MKLIRKFWIPGLILMMVAVHAGIIGYVRSRVARLHHSESNAVELGEFRFQCVDDLSRVYHFRLHAIVDPARRNHGNDRLRVMELEIREAAEQMLRQTKPEWLDDPTQSQLRSRLMDVVLQHLDEPVVQRMVITDWLELPVSTVDLPLQSNPKTVAVR